MTQVANYAVPPGPRASVRQGINAVLAALRDDNAGPTAPPNPVPGMMWLDMSTTPPTPRRRNAGNTAWNTENIAMTAAGLAVVTAENAAAQRTAMGLDNLVVPAGMVGYCAMQTPPAGWLVHNGAAYSRAVYPALFAAIGLTYTVGNNGTTFNVPDDRSNFDRGHDGGRGIDVGRVFGSEQLDQMQRITGAMTSGFVTSAGGGAVTDGAITRSAAFGNGNVIAGLGSATFSFDSANSPSARITNHIWGNPPTQPRISANY